MTSRPGTRGDETQHQQALIAIRQTRNKRYRHRGILVSAVGLVVASAAVTVMMLASRPSSSTLGSQSLTSSSGMSGMDHGPGDMPGMKMDPGATEMPGRGASPSPSEMPGMGTDHGAKEMPEMNPEHVDKPAADRPLVPVLGTFGGGTSAVMLAAGFLRRRDRASRQAKEAARAARRAQS